MRAVSWVNSAGSGGRRPSPPHRGMASAARCPPRPPGAPDPIERGKPGALAGCACACCPAKKERQGLCALRAPAYGLAGGTYTRGWRGPRGAPPRRAQARTEIRGLPTRRGARCALRARHPTPSACPAHAPWRRPAALVPSFPRDAGGASHLFAPVEEALALGPHVEQRPHPLAQLLNCGFARHVLNGARLGAVDGANLDPHLGAGRGGRLFFVCPCAQDTAPRPARAASPVAPALRGRRARARTSEENRPDAGPDRQPQLLDRAPAQRSTGGKETGTSRRRRCCRRRCSPRLTNRKKPCLRGAECLLIEL